MLRFLSFLKKNNSSQDQPAPATPDAGLADVRFFVMPRKSGSIAGAGMHHTKKWGLVIVGVGGTALAASVVFLVWYIFFANGQPASPASSAGGPAGGPSVNVGSAPVVSEPAPAVPTENVASPQPPADDLSEKACGSTVLLSSATRQESADMVLTCIGERIASSCKRAAAMFDTPDMQVVRLAVLGLRQEACLVQLTYPAASSITDETAQVYANTYIRCPYNIDDPALADLNPADLAMSVYRQSDVLDLTSGRNCEGTAVTAWEQSQSQAPVPPTSFLPGVDTDTDGLTDVEENTVFATSAAQPDTDGDTYGDGSEVLNGYNPAGAGTLADSGLVAVHRNDRYGYNVLYPTAWRIEDAANGDNVIFMAGIGGFIQIVVQENSDQKNLAQWYADANIGTAVAEVENLSNGFEMLQSPDGLTLYLTEIGGGNQVYVFTYSPAQTKRLEFKHTLLMMARTFSRTSQ